MLSGFPEDTRALDLRKRAKYLTRFLSELSVTLAKQLDDYSQLEPTSVLLEPIEV